MSDVALELADRYRARGLLLAADRVLRAAGDTPTVLAARAEVALDAGAVNAARDLARDYLRLAPGARARVLLGRAQLACRDLDAARASAAVALDSRGATPGLKARAHALLAQVARQQPGQGGASAAHVAEAEALLAGAPADADASAARAELGPPAAGLPMLGDEPRLELAVAAADLARAIRREPGRDAWWRDAVEVLVADDAGADDTAAQAALLGTLVARVGVTAAVQRLLAAAREVARDEVLASQATHGHRLKNLVGVLAARARGLRRDGATTALAPRLGELEVDLTSLYDAWAATLRAMQLELPTVATVDVATWLADVVAAARDRFADVVGLLLELDVAADMPPLRADARLLGEAVANLITNAVEAGEPAAARAIAVVARADASGALVLTVRDDGPGLPPGHGAPGYTSKPSGSGLGLAIVERVVAAHRGRLTLRSDAAGTLATITLPLDGIGVRWRRPR